MNLDVRRLWTCPLCGRSAKTNGTVSAKRCSCGKEDDVWMQLIEDVEEEVVKENIEENVDQPDDQPNHESDGSHELDELDESDESDG